MGKYKVTEGQFENVNGLYSLLSKQLDMMYKYPSSYTLGMFDKIMSDLDELEYLLDQMPYVGAEVDAVDYRRIKEIAHPQYMTHYGLSEYL